MPMLYIVTPTYRRPEMIAELTRLGQTLLLLPRVHWIIAEDSHSCSSAITDTLRRIGEGQGSTSAALPSRTPYAG